MHALIPSSEGNHMQKHFHCCVPNTGRPTLSRVLCTCNEHIYCTLTVMFHKRWLQKSFCECLGISVYQSNKLCPGGLKWTASVLPHASQLRNHSTPCHKYMQTLCHHEACRNTEHWYYCCEWEHVSLTIQNYCILRSTVWLAAYGGSTVLVGQGTKVLINSNAKD